MAPHGIQIDDAGTIYVTCDISRKLLVIDPKARSIKAAIDTEGTGHWVAVLPDASKAYVANKNNKLFISVIDLKKRRIVTRIPAPNGTQGIAASPDGKYVVAVDYAEPKLLVIDPATDMVELTHSARRQHQGRVQASVLARWFQAAGLQYVGTAGEHHQRRGPSR